LDKKRQPVDELAKLEARAARLRDKETRARLRAEKLERKLDRLRSAAIPAGATAPTAEPPPGPAVTPTGVRAIRMLLAEETGRVWSAVEIHHELASRGWISVTARYRLQGVEAVISRLVRRGELVRVSPGRYRLLADSAADGRQVPGARAAVASPPGTTQGAATSGGDRRVPLAGGGEPGLRAISPPFFPGPRGPRAVGVTPHSTFDTSPWA